MCGRHVARHGRAHALLHVRLDGQRAARGTLHVFGGRGAAGAGGLDGGEIDVEAPRERAYGGRRLHFRTRFQIADHGAGIGGGALEANERSADMDLVARRAEQLLHLAAERSGHFDDRLVGLDRDHRLVGLDGLAGLHVPLDDLGFLQALPEVGQVEDAHYWYSRTFRAAAATRAAFGM